MNPNNIEVNDPAAYLNQIAPKAPSKVDYIKQKPVILGILLIATIIIFALLAMFSSLSNNSNSTQRLAARLVSTQDTADKSTQNIKSTALRALNSNLDLYLTNTIRDITPILKAKGAKINSLNKGITASESNIKTLATLEDARLNAVFDRTYAREMAYQLSTVLTLMKEIKNGTNSTSTKSFLDDAITNLGPTQKQFADFNAADS